MESMSQQRLIAEIEAFCRRHSLYHADFGEMAVNDRAFYLKMTRGRDPKLTTINRIREFMQDYERQAAVRAEKTHPQGQGGRGA